MAEGIVVTVSDNVSARPAIKIREIGNEARDAHRYVELLKNELASMGAAVSPVAALSAQLQRTQTAASRLQAEQARAATAVQRLATASTQGATATQRLQAAQTGTVTASQRLATAQAQTAAATSNAAAAAARASTAQLQLQQAQARTERASLGASNGVMQFMRQLVGVAVIIAFTRAIIGLADGYTALENKLGTVSTSIAQTNELKRQTFDLAQRASMGVDTVVQSFTRFDRSLAPLGKSQAEVLRMTETVSKALFVGGATAQESASAMLQLSQGFNAGRLQGEEFRAVSEAMPSAIVAIGKVLGVTTGEVKKMGSEGKITSEIMFKAFQLIEAETDRAFNKMDKTIAMATTNAKNSLQFLIGAMDDATGASRAISGALMEMSSMMDQATAAFNAGDSQVMVYLKTIGDLVGMMISFVGGVLSDLIGGIRTLTGETSNTSNGMWLLETALKAVIIVFQTVLVVGSDIVFIFRSIYMEAKAAIEQIVALLSFDWGKVTGIKEALDKDTAEAYASLQAFQKKVMSVNLTPKTTAQAQYDNYENRRNAGRTVGTTGVNALRQAGPNRNPTRPDTNSKEAKAAENRAAAMAKVNAQLDNEIARMGMLKPMRDDQAAFDQIQEGLLGRKIKLTATEAESIKRRITLIREQKVVQGEMDRIYEDAVAPARTLNATMKAADDLMRAGKISQEQYNREVFKSGEAYLNAIDPMRQFNIELEKQVELSRMRPEQQQLAGVLTQAQSAKGSPLTAAEIDLLTQRHNLIVANTKAQEAENAIIDATAGTREEFLRQLTAIKNLTATGAITGADADMQTVGILRNMGIDPSALEVGMQAQLATYANYQAQVKSMLDAGVINQRDATQAIMQIRQMEQSVGLAKASEFFTGLAALQNSNNKKMVAVGKAAAIANTMIKTYESATGAYNAMVGIPYIGPALAIAAAAAAVAAGMANVAAIKSQGAGFMAGGFTGQMGTGAVAGVVHGQEFVTNAAATRRNRPILEAMNRGADFVNANSGGGSGDTYINFDFDYNIVMEGGGGGGGSVKREELEEVLELASKRTQGDILESARTGGLWSKAINV